MGIAVYFEIITNGKPEYYCRRFKTVDRQIREINRRMLWESTRVWKEENGADIGYLKNRTSDLIVDLKEFFWVKLQAK